MKVAQEQHLINAAKTSKKVKETCILDIRETQWQKIGGVWKSVDGWTPTDPESVIKIEQWVKEITRIMPRASTREDNEDPDSLDHQLSAVEGHKKIEIDETKHTWTEAEVEQPEEEPRIGEEIEKEPWVPRAKIELAILLGAIIAGFFIYANSPSGNSDAKIFIQEELNKLEDGPWDTGEAFAAIGQVDIYNKEWPNSKSDVAAIRGAVTIIMKQYKNNKLEKMNLTEEEQAKRIEDINKLKRPMLIIRPEGEKGTKLWVSPAATIIKETKTEDGQLTWEFMRAEDLNSIPYLMN
jgi:hypothetical protein